jgi:hypothetical protein
MVNAVKSFRNATKLKKLEMADANRNCDDEYIHRSRVEAG